MTTVCPMFLLAMRKPIADTKKKKSETNRSCTLMPVGRRVSHVLPFSEPGNGPAKQKRRAASCRPCTARVIYSRFARSSYLLGAQSLAKASLG